MVTLLYGFFVGYWLLIEKKMQLVYNIIPDIFINVMSSPQLPEFKITHYKLIHRTQMDCPKYITVAKMPKRGLYVDANQ